MLAMTTCTRRSPSLQTAVAVLVSVPFLLLVSSLRTPCLANAFSLATSSRQASASAAALLATSSCAYAFTRQQFGRRASFAGIVTAKEQCARAPSSSLDHAPPPPPATSSNDATDNDNAASLLRSMTFCNLQRTEQPQLLCDFLMEIGACSCSIVDADRDSPLERAIYREHQESPTVEEAAAEAAAVVLRNDAVGRNVWNRCNVTAHFAASADLDVVAEMVSQTLELSLNVLCSVNVTSVPDRDWVAHVQQGWKPILVSGIVLRFPWHSQQDVANVLADVGEKDNVVELQLQGGVAFGTGEHPTTQLCLEWIQHLLTSCKDDDDDHELITTLLDYGTGSGVLGLAACALSDGRVQAVGVDIDIDAVRIANANAKINGLSMKSYLPSLEETEDSESKSLLMKAHHHLSDSTTAITNNRAALRQDDNGSSVLYDVCVANILASPLVTLAPTLASMLKPNGRLGLSGILNSQADMVINAYSEYFDNVRVENEKGGWILVTGTRKA